MFYRKHFKNNNKNDTKKKKKKKKMIRTVFKNWRINPNVRR